MHSFIFVICRILLILFALSHPASALKVVTSIRPVHSLVAAVMEGTGSPYLIIRSSASPHDYSLRPSDAKSLENAQVVFWMGAGLENFLTAPLLTLAPRAHSVELLDTPGLQLLPNRNLLATPNNAAVAKATLGHGDLNQDPHAWLDPENARQMLTIISQVLATADPDNAMRYQRNAQRLDLRLVELSAGLNQRLAPIREQPYVVYHDAYQYFEHRFKLKPAAAVSLNPELPAGARRVREIQELIHRQNIRCLFTEPQFKPRLLQLLLNIPGVRSTVLDPLGTDIQPGPGLYERMMQKNASALINCLSR